MNHATLGWRGIVRLGLVQTALGAIVVLTTSTINRIMVVELALPAMLPGALVAFHYAIQILRPRLGHGADAGGRLTPWIIGGIGVLAIGGTLAAGATALMADRPAAGMALAFAAFALIGLGVGAAGTSLLALLAKRVAPQRRAAAATIVWVMMIAGFAVTAGIAGRFLDPFSPARLIAVTATVSALAFLIACAAVFRVESPGGAPRTPGASPAPARRPEGTRFRAALAAVWQDDEARRFTLFVFVSMLAYSLQDLILEPFAGTIFAMTPGESTSLAGAQHGGVLGGMILVAVTCSGPRRLRLGTLRQWTIGGCIASALGLAALAFGGLQGAAWPLRLNVVLLGAANGAFAVAAIGSMMALAGGGQHPSQRSREGIRMGLWGAAQAIAFGIGGFAGTAGVDLARMATGSPGIAYASVFALEALLFLVSVLLVGPAANVARPDTRRTAAGGSRLAPEH